jgi:hypothetical protein
LVIFEFTKGCNVRTKFRLVGILALAAAAFAQSDRGTITGTVSDPGGAIVAGAAIEARNLSTGLT